MKIIYKAPGCAPEPRDIPNDLKELQVAVGGRIETVTIATDACVVCNEEGRLMGLPYNCAFFGFELYGPILIVGLDGEGFADLSPEGMRLILNRWKA